MYQLIFSYLNHGDQLLVGYSDIIGTVTEEDNSDKEDEMEIAVSESQPPHVDRKIATESLAILSNNQFLKRTLI